MSIIELTQHGASGEDRTPLTMRRIGQIAGVLSIAVVVFACLYFLILYIASE
jgi:hypothetical protein